MAHIYPLIISSGEKIDVCALIGADGMWSKIREVVVGYGKPRTSGHIAYSSQAKCRSHPLVER